MKAILLMMATLILTSCKYGVTFNEIKSLKELKEEVEIASSEDLTQENQVKLRNYFSKIKDISYSFINNSSMQSYSQKKFLKFFNENLCDEILLDEVRYSEIMRKCSVNGFYICSEEVKSYSSMLKSVKKKLTEFQMGKIVSNKQCKAKLLNLGVIHE